MQNKWHQDGHAGLQTTMNQPLGTFVGGLGATVPAKVNGIPVGHGVSLELSSPFTNIPRTRVSRGKRRQT